MTDRVEPFEALRLPELPDGPGMSDAFTALITAVAGFPHPGIAADSLAYGLRWLRANPDQADILLGRGATGGYGVSDLVSRPGATEPGE